MQCYDSARKLHEKVRNERKRDLKSYLLKKEKESMFQNVRQNIQQDMTSKPPKISGYQAFENAFQIFCSHSIKQWIYTTDKETVEVELKSKSLKNQCLFQRELSLICKKMSTYTGEPPA